ncbi:hypothetical protein IJ732_05225 [bacterium]|nr:hypothetical protein [bacterium]
MILSKIGFNIGENIKTFASNPIKKCFKPVENNLSPLKQDVVQISNETQKFIKKFAGEYPNTSSTKINGQSFTKYNGSQMGSNPAFWATNDSTGELFYIKMAGSSSKTAHLQEEVTATNLYKLAGLNAPDVEMCKLQDGSMAMKSKFTPGLSEIKNSKDVHEGFAADAWLANWDSLLWGNTQVKDGHSFKIDNGGALRFRAQGAPKPNFGDRVNELTTLVDGRNWQSTSMYNNISHEDLVNSFKRVCNIKDNDIKNLVKDKDLAQTLIARKAYLSDVLQKIEENPKGNETLISYFNKLKV